MHDDILFTSFKVNFETNLLVIAWQLKAVHKQISGIGDSHQIDLCNVIMLFYSSYNTLFFIYFSNLLYMMSKHWGIDHHFEITSFFPAGLIKLSMHTN